MKRMKKWNEKEKKEENKVSSGADSDFSFIRETIKERPVNKQKLFRRTVITAFSAVVFGLVACFTFLVLEPVISNKLYPEEITKVEFPEEEKETLPEEMLTEDSLQEEMEANILQQIGNQETESEFTVEEYQGIYDKLYEIANTASQYMVKVTCTTQNSDWLQGVFENENDLTGVIVADNEVEYLILAETNQSQEVDEYHVTFKNGKTEPAALKAVDKQTGLGIFGVKYAGFSDEEKAGIAVASLGNSNNGRIIGRPVIAIGSPQGKSGSITYGIITSTSGTVNLADSIYRMLDSDMYGNENSGGVFINLAGEVLGIITNNSTEDQNENGKILSAFGISDLTNMIEKFSNGETLAYAGIIGKDVTKEAHESLAMPYGAYVSEAALQSPAMESGIKSNDVIVKIDENDITSYREYKEAIFAKKPGDTVILHIMRHNGSEYIPLEVSVSLVENR